MSEGLEVELLPQGRWSEMYCLTTEMYDQGRLLSEGLQH